MTDPEKLRELADWFDSNYPPIHSPAHVKEVQFDLRRIAYNLEKMDPEYTPKKYVYFVSYSYSYGFGCTELTISGPITGMDDLNQIAEAIKKEKGFKAFATLNYQLLRTE